MSDNLLTGAIPGAMMALTTLTVLKTCRNKFEGVTPAGLLSLGMYVSSNVNMLGVQSSCHLCHNLTSLTAH